MHFRCSYVRYRFWIITCAVFALAACHSSSDSVTADPAPVTGSSAMLLTSSDGGDNMLGTMSGLSLMASDPTASFLKFGGYPSIDNADYSPTGHSLVFNSTDNKFYGVLHGAGVDKIGVLMSFDPSADKLTMLKSFVRNVYPDVTGVNGEVLPFLQPYGFYRRPLLSPDGKSLLLRASLGGVDNRGALIHLNIDPSSANYLKDTIVYSFFDYEKLTSGNYCDSLRSGGDDSKITEMVWGKDIGGNAVAYMGVNGESYDVDNTTNPTNPKTCAPYTDSNGNHLDRIKGRMFALRPTDPADLSKPWGYSNGYTPFDPELALGRQIYWDTRKQAVRWTTSVVGGGAMDFYTGGSHDQYIYNGIAEQCYRLHGLLPQDSNGNSIAMCSGQNGSPVVTNDSPPRIFRYSGNDLLSQQALFGGWYADKKFFRGATSSLVSRRLFVNGGDLGDNCANTPNASCESPSTIEELDPILGYFQNVLAAGDVTTTGKFFYGDPAVGGSIREPIADRYVVWFGTVVKGYSTVLNKYDRATGQTSSIPMDPTNGAHPVGRLLDLGNGQALGMLGSAPPTGVSHPDPAFVGIGGYGGGPGYSGSRQGHVLYDLKTGKIIRAVSQDATIDEFSRERVKLDDGTLWEAIDYYVQNPDTRDYFRAFNKIDPTSLKLTWVADKLDNWSFPRDPFTLAGRGSTALYLPFWKANFDTTKRYADVTLGCMRTDSTAIYQSPVFGPAQAGMLNAHRIVYGATYSAANKAMYLATSKVGDADLGTIFEIDKNVADSDLCRAAPAVTVLVTGLVDVPSTKIEALKSGSLVYGTVNGKLMMLDVAGKRAVLVADLKGALATSSRVRGYVSEVSDNVVALVVYDYNASGQNISRRLVTVNLGSAAVSSRDVTKLISEFEPYPGVLRLN